MTKEKKYLCLRIYYKIVSFQWNIDIYTIDLTTYLLQYVDIMFIMMILIKSWKLQNWLTNILIVKLALKFLKQQISFVYGDISSFNYSCVTQWEKK